MLEVPRQQSAATTPRAGYLPALHRLARGPAKLVPHQPATETDQDPRPPHHLPAGRGGRHRPDGARHLRRNPHPFRLAAMNMTALHAEPGSKLCPLGWDTAGLPASSHAGGRLRDHRRRLGPKTLDQLAEAGDLDVKRHATWGNVG